MLEALLELILQLFLGVAVRLPGYWFLRCFHSPRELDFEGTTVAVVGGLLWLFVGSVVAVSLFFLLA